MIQDCLFVFYVPSTARSFLETAPHLLSLMKDEKLGKYIVPTGNRTPGCRVAVHYSTAAPRQLPRDSGKSMEQCNVYSCSYHL